MREKNILAVHNVSKTFITQKGDTFLATKDIHLEIPEKSFTCIVGPSGCGKSTILRIMAGLEKATTGEAYYRSSPITKPCGEIGVVFQEYSLFPWMTVLENIGAGPLFAGIKEKKRLERALHYLNMVNMDGFKDAYPHELSGGMRQRVAIARALANNPDVLLMDEPFGALDAHTRILLQKELLKVWQLTNKTIVLVTHSVDEAIFLSDRIIIMSKGPGQIRRELDVDMARPRSRALQKFGQLTDSILQELE